MQLLYNKTSTRSSGCTIISSNLRSMVPYYRFVVCGIFGTSQPLFSGFLGFGSTCLESSRLLLSLDLNEEGRSISGGSFLMLESCSYLFTLPLSGFVS
ncbi:unnamed protein product, partial [Vitis vinifera]